MSDEYQDAFVGIDVAFAKLVPVIFTLVPPATPPLAGATLVTAGGAT